MTQTSNPTISSITIVLPAYNEEADLPGLLERLQGSLSLGSRAWRIVVVDDGSADRTADVARAAADRFPVVLIQHEKNQGLGRAMQTGLTAAAAYGGAVITMDADNSHDPKYIEQMVNKLEEEPAVDVVICSRYQAGSQIVGLSLYRKLLSLGCFALMKCVVPFRGVRDYSTGFRAYRATTLQKTIDAYQGRLVEVQGFACMLEITLKLRSLCGMTRNRVLASCAYSAP
jgi:dolichol-phosphate mannosyltransferase